MKITIDKKLYNLCPSMQLGILEYDVTVMESCGLLQSHFDDSMAHVDIEMADIVHIKPIADTRAAYKALGKSPSKYRNAAEAMLRRVVKQKGLYHINNIIDIQNRISVLTGYSIGSYDMDRLHGEVHLVQAEPKAHYEGIGKRSVNIENLPVLQDDAGYFGNPTSDSPRAMVTAGEHQILTVIYGFTPLTDVLALYQADLQKFTDARIRRVEVVT